MRRIADSVVIGANASAPALPHVDPSLACFLEEIYAECNRPERLELDPLAVAKRYTTPADIEVAGLICSTLAFGSVELILRACERALEPLGSHPAEALVGMGDADIARAWAEFQYRFCFPRDIIGLMWAIRAALREYGSLEALFVDGEVRPPVGATVGADADALADPDADTDTDTDTDTCAAMGTPFGTMASALPKKSDDSIIMTTSRFVRRLRSWSAEICPGGIRKNLLPDPADGSASKRLFLYLRWMVRHDAIDPGCWHALSPARLIVPMDTHMIRTCTERLGFLSPRGSGVPPAATLRNAIRVTEAFRCYAPDDPVKYDFALTRPGIDPRPGDERFGCR